MCKPTRANFYWADWAERAGPKGQTFAGRPAEKGPVHRDGRPVHMGCGRHKAFKGRALVPPVHTVQAFPLPKGEPCKILNLFTFFPALAAGFARPGDAINPSPVGL
jgi:hypothetical protein